MNPDMIKKKAPEGASFKMLAAATETVAENVAISVATEAGQQENPDNPFAAVIAVSASKATTIIIVAAAEEQKKDDPNPATASTIRVSCTTTVVVASAVCCCQIAHFCLQSFVMLYTMQCGLSLFPVYFLFDLSQ